MRALVLSFAIFLAACTAAEPPPEIYFSPAGGATAALVREISRARTSIHVLDYALTSQPIAAALIAAHDRGVDVQIGLDRLQAASASSLARRLAAAGIPVWTRPGSGLLHDKLTIIDGLVVATGSFNYTANAEKSNAENLVILHDPAIAAACEAQFAAVPRQPLLP